MIRSTGQINGVQCAFYTARNALLLQDRVLRIRCIQQDTGIGKCSRHCGLLDIKAFTANAVRHGLLCARLSKISRRRTSTLRRFVRSARFLTMYAYAFAFALATVFVRRYASLSALSARRFRRMFFSISLCQFSLKKRLTFF